MPNIFTDWTISQALWDALRELLRPGMATLETGSGLSTLLIEAAGCRHTALEHNLVYAAPSKAVLLRPLVGEPPWYDWDPPHPFDLVLIDGPPGGGGGRLGILRVIQQLVKPTTIVVLDDTHRRDERRLADVIGRQYDLRASHYQDNKRGFSILKP